MKKIKTTAIVTVNSGEIALSGAQAKTRMHCLNAVKVDKKTGDGVYAIKAPIQFKAGEEFGYDGESGKNGIFYDPAVEELQKLEALDRARAEGHAAGRAEAEKGFAAAIEQARAEGHAAGLAEGRAAKGEGA